MSTTTPATIAATGTEDQELHRKIARADAKAAAQPLVDFMLITPKQVAEALQVSPAVIYRLVADGHLEAVKIGGSYRFWLDEVRRYARTGSPVTA